MTIEEITTGLMIGKTITDKTIGETIIGKTIEGTTEIGKCMEEMTPNTGIEREVRVERVQDNTIVIILEVEIGVETDKYNKESECYQMIETGQVLGLDLTLG